MLIFTLTLECAQHTTFPCSEVEKNDAGEYSGPQPPVGVKVLPWLPFLGLELSDKHQTYKACRVDISPNLVFVSML